MQKILPYPTARNSVSYTRSNSTPPPNTSLTDPANTLPTFTHFPALPLEIRTSIWEYISNIPRNLDIHVQTLGTIDLQWSARSSNSFCSPFRFTTTRPVPSILHTSQEARAVGLQFYQLGFGVVHEMFDQFVLELKVPGRIYLNRGADRVCPMGGEWGEDATYELWANCMGDSSCAVDVAQQAHLDFLLEDGWGFPDQILLYGNEWPGEVGSIRAFGFVDVREEGAAEGEWGELVRAREGLRGKMRVIEENRREKIRKWKRWRGEEVSEGDEIEVEFGGPEIRLVRIVGDGEMGEGGFLGL